MTMRHLTAAEMREADRRCIEELGVPGAVLMNNAGHAVYREIRGGTVGFVCGKGNNGGDGFVAARLALVAGHDTQVVLLGAPEDVRGDAATFLHIYRRLGGALVSVTDEDAAREAVADMGHCACVVDAMLGTGVEGEVRGLCRAAIDAWPEGAFTVAVDLPSGLHTDTGEILGAAIRAAVTVTFQFPKRAFQHPGAQAFTGRLAVADIGIPPVCADDDAWAALKAGWTGTNAP